MAETVDTYTFQPAGRSFFSAKPSNKTPKSIPFIHTQPKVIKVKPIKTSKRR